MQRYIYELVGTFFLVLIIGLAVHLAPPGLAPAAVGIGLMALVYACGPVSAAHFNPAVTIAFWLRGTFARKDIGPYIGAQVVGAIGAALCVIVLLDAQQVAIKAGGDMAIAGALLAEVLFTFALVWVILNVAALPAASGNPWYGAAIGAVVMAGAWSVGPISGAVFNPAVAVGLVVAGMASPGALWIYLAADFGGAVLATLLFRYGLRVAAGAA
ncbi:MAG: MIP/aquaporin family protein [Planctomycetota bacterium]